MKPPGGGHCIYKPQPEAGYGGFIPRYCAHDQQLRGNAGAQGSGSNAQGGGGGGGVGGGGGGRGGVPGGAFGGSSYIDPCLFRPYPIPGYCGNIPKYCAHSDTSRNPTGLPNVPGGYSSSKGRLEKASPDVRKASGLPPARPLAATKSSKSPTCLYKPNPVPGTENSSGTGRQQCGEYCDPKRGICKAGCGPSWSPCYTGGAAKPQQQVGPQQGAHPGAGDQLSWCGTKTCNPSMGPCSPGCGPQSGCYNSGQDQVKSPCPPGCDPQKGACRPGCGPQSGCYNSGQDQGKVPCPPGCDPQKGACSPGCGPSSLCTTAGGYSRRM